MCARQDNKGWNSAQFQIAHFERKNPSPKLKFVVTNSSGSKVLASVPQNKSEDLGALIISLR